MHLYFTTRGVKHFRDLFVTMMQSQMFPWKRKNLKTGKEEWTNVQGALRPIELWEYVFPEESLPEVLAMLNIYSGKEASHNVDWRNKLGIKKANAMANFLRKAVGAKKIPNIKAVEKNRFVSMEAMALHPIGIKKDARGKMPWGYEQEEL